MGHVILITGGSRSGKSQYALEKAESLSDKRLFLATCPVVDGELSQRVQLHQDERKGRNWTTVEEEVDIARVIKNATNTDVLLVDCLTLWINNLIFSQPENFSFTKEWLEQKIAEWHQETLSFSGTIILVTGEVGLGIVPENSLSRLYRDLVGWCNQIVAGTANEVFFISCGLPLQLK